MKNHVVCLSTTNYHPLPTRKQNVMSRLRGAEVLYFDPPVSIIAPLKDKKASAYISKYKQPGEKVEGHENITVYALPPVLPFFNKFRWVNKLNQKRQAAFVRKKMREHGFGDETVLWCYSPSSCDIVEHVRDYARKRRRQITPVDLTQMSAKVVSSMRASNARVSFESEVPAGLFVEGDSLEIELVLRNLVKNAGESAAQADGVPRVVLAGERIGDEVVITVTDNGPVRTKAEIDAFLVPLRSEKSGGLGLGLAIVRRIIEAYGGTIVFDVVEPQGVRVEARLPARPDL